MKTTRLNLIAILFLCAMGWTYAQNNPNPQLLMIHEDNVLVDKVAEYNQACEGMIKLLSENNYKNMNFSALRQDDYTYMFVSEIENMAELDKSPFEDLIKQVGEEKANKVMAAFDGTYDTHRDFIAIFHPELSYKPEQLQEEGNNYREWMYLYYNQSNQEQVMNLSREWKKLYEDNNITSGYTIYTNGFGHEGPVLVVHSWAKSPSEFYQQMAKRNEILGNKAQELWGRTEKLIYRIENKKGWLIPELSYMPQE